ncbi:MAG: thiamine phosphate synthase [Bacteroidia bacterium]|nr:thiamine phosphate synthase [Bacteroidia bacterium]MCX7653023.1 thiamine phosphate synthase [Bacteroidia bacterium]MDW8416161.1 thiamine phosphate synthase [Bacteroidia bacterium]
MRPHIGRIHIITDTEIQSRYSHADLVALALQGGAPTIQYRHKAFKREYDLSELYEIVRLVRAHQSQLIVNDYVDIAIEVQADGVHLGEEDMPLEEAFRRLPPSMMVGATVHSLERYGEIRHFPIAYVGVGSVFATNTKSPKTPPLGIEGLRSFVESISHPVIAIGGITPERAKMLFDAIPGLYGVAVVSAFCQADDPVRTVRELLATLPA